MFKRHDLVETKPTASRLETTLAVFLYDNGVCATVLFWLPKAGCLYGAMSIALADVVGPAKRVPKALRAAHAEHVAVEQRIAAAHGLTLETMYPTA
jgi:hypothetical protein